MEGLQCICSEKMPPGAGHTRTAIEVESARDNRLSSLAMAARLGHINCVKYLIEKCDAYGRQDDRGTNPLVLASLYGHRHIVDFMISMRGLTSKKERIEALDLLGASYVERYRDLAGALKVWNAARNERNRGMRHGKSEQELSEANSNPIEIRCLALLVLERVSGLAQPTLDTNYITFRRSTFANANDFDQCITIWLENFNRQPQVQERRGAVTQLPITLLIAFFSYLLIENQFEVRMASSVDFFDLLYILESVLKILERGRSETGEHTQNYLILALNVMRFVKYLEPRFSDIHAYALQRTVYDIVQLDPKGTAGASFLHLACEQSSSKILGLKLISAFPDVKTVNLLLEYGADPCAVDDRGDTPLHTLARNDQSCPKIVESLLLYGTHLDAANRRGETFASLRASRGEKLCQFVNPLKHISLKCLAAAAIRRHGIAYEAILPKRLADFVRRH
ncbi:protein fem-1 homolog A-like isoform X2 [Macrobrachium rosenbergii]|uniref:protein fem-1 homolog A-like isoform X2 n=1 Tax=Macrobrachium rosenbergii TaxID=79674 RepID=UPI0034D5AE06